MTLEEGIALCRIRQNTDIQRKEQLFIGYRALLIADFGMIDTVMIEHRKDEVKSLRAFPEITHKNWKEKGLIQPIQSEELAQYSFTRSSNVAVLHFYI